MLNAHRQVTSFSRCSSWASGPVQLDMIRITKAVHRRSAENLQAAQLDMLQDTVEQGQVAAELPQNRLM